MDEAIYVVFYIILTVAVLTAHIYGYMFVFYPKALYRLVDVAFNYEKKFTWPDRVPPKFHPIRLWRALFVIISMVGLATILYSGFLQALHWMPYDWRDDDGAWVAEFTAGLLAAHSFLFVVCCWLPKLNKDRGMDE